MKHSLDYSQSSWLSRAGAAVGLCIILLYCAGCSHPQIYPSGFLDKYELLRYDRESGIYSYDKAELLREEIHIILLNDVQWWAGGDIAFEWSEELCRVAKERLRFRILKEVKGLVFVLDHERNLLPYRDMPGVRVLTVDSAITHIDKGIGLGRYAVGLGMGNAKVSLEISAKRSDEGAESIHQAVVFADSHGNPHGGLNPRSFSGLYSLRLACDSAATQVAHHLADRILLPEAEWWKNPNMQEDITAQ